MSENVSELPSVKSVTVTCAIDPDPLLADKTNMLLFKLFSNEAGKGFCDCDKHDFIIFKTSFSMLPELSKDGQTVLMTSFILFSNADAWFEKEIINIKLIDRIKAMYKEVKTLVIFQNVYLEL
jgi:hypothetical protein